MKTQEIKVVCNECKGDGWTDELAHCICEGTGYMLDTHPLYKMSLAKARVEQENAKASEPETIKRRVMLGQALVAIGMLDEYTDLGANADSYTFEHVTFSIKWQGYNAGGGDYYLALNPACEVSGYYAEYNHYLFNKDGTVKQLTNSDLHDVLNDFNHAQERFYTERFKRRQAITVYPGDPAYDAVKALIDLYSV